MAASRSTAASSTRVIHAVIGLAHLVVGIALGAAAALSAPVELPIALSIPVSDPIGAFAQVDFAAAGAVVVLISAAAHGVIAILLWRDASAHRARLLQLVAFAQGSAITVFLVAQLNGVAEAGALILVYAIAGAAAGLLWLQAHEVDERSRARWPFSFGAGIAVVPWGVVALYQVVGLAAGSPPPGVVRVVTLVILLIVALAWWVERRVQLGTLPQQRGLVLHAGLSLANGVALLVLAAVLAQSSAIPQARTVSSETTTGIAASPFWLLSLTPEDGCHD